MTIPGFTAEASLYLSVRSYLTQKIVTPSGAIIPSGLFGPPQINVSYQPPPYPADPKRSPGTLTITGQNFVPNSQVGLFIEGCLDPPYVYYSTTDGFKETCYEVLGHRRCAITFGGSFTYTTPRICTCPGTASVTAYDLSGNAASSATVDLRCPSA
jgi:hypothetical protein